MRGVHVYPAPRNEKTVPHTNDCTLVPCSPEEKPDVPLASTDRHERQPPDKMGLNHETDLTSLFLNLSHGDTLK